MGVTRNAPWWLTWVLFAGLVLIFAGERVIGGVGTTRVILSVLGSAVVLGTVVWRVRSWRASRGDARQAETILTLAYGGIALALLLYLISTSYGMRWLGIEFEADGSRIRYTGILGVLWPIILATSLLPALWAQLAVGAHRHAKALGAGVEAVRVRGMAKSGLTIALAGAFLIVAGYIATQRDRSIDLSYFRTASPGESTISIVRSMTEPLRVVLFYPEINPVKDEAMRYFRSLSTATGRVIIESHDRLVRPDLAAEYSVTEDGSIVFVAGERSEQMFLGTDLQNATRHRLRTLDAEVQRRLMALVRETGTVYFTTGHGELNDPVSAGPLAAEGLGGLSTFHAMLRALNHNIANLGLTTGLANDVPSDAAMVIIMGPRRPFLPEEMAALERYLDRGGSILIALDRQGEFELGPLERRLNLRFNRELLVDDIQHLVQRNNPSDRQLIFTNRFSSHEAVTTAARASSTAAVVFLGAGHLTLASESYVSPEVARTLFPDSVPPESEELPRPYYVVQTLPTTFADLDGDFEFDDGEEVRRQYNLVAAVEKVIAAPRNVDPAPEDGGEVSVALAAEERVAGDAAGEASAAGGDDAAGDVALAGASESVEASEDDGEPLRMRALVYADARIFTDAVLNTFGLNAALVADGIRWLRGEEELSGPVASEADVPILHTRAENVVWFYSTILGAPALVLILGLTGVYLRRRRRARPQGSGIAEVTP